MYHLFDELKDTANLLTKENCQLVLNHAEFASEINKYLAPGNNLTLTPANFQKEILNIVEKIYEVVKEIKKLRSCMGKLKMLAEESNLSGTEKQKFDSMMEDEEIKIYKCVVADRLLTVDRFNQERAELQQSISKAFNPESSAKFFEEKSFFNIIKFL